MNNEEILNQARAYVQKELENDASGHDWWHIVRVTRTAKLLAMVEQADMFICELAALLHDIADEKLAGSKQAGMQKVTEWLDLTGVEVLEKNAVLEIISTMSFGGGGGKAMTTLEGQIVQDADRLDAIGAIGIARTFVYSGSKGTLIYDPALKYREVMTKEQYRKDKSTAINHYYEKLLKLKSQMNTNAAKLLAEKRHRVMEDYLEAFDQEWSLGNTDYLKESLIRTKEHSRIHIIFGESAASSLRGALRVHHAEDRVICLSDDLMVGPLHDADDPVGLTKRLEWWRLFLLSRGQSEQMEHILEAALDWRQWPTRLQEEPLVIWAGDSPAEQIGLRRLLAALPHHQNIHHVDASGIMREDHKDVVYLDTSEIRADEFLPLLEKARRLLPKDQEPYVAEWREWVAWGGTLRVLSKGTLKQVEEDYYDETIMQVILQLSAVSEEAVRCSRIVGEVLGQLELRTGDQYIEARIRQLIQQGKLLYSGDLDSMRSYSIRLA